MKLADVVFLDVDDVEAAHAGGIATAGGDPALRDRGLLESAVMQPQATFDGAPLYDSLAMMAAIYLVGLARNHAFVDGNKRVALLAAVAFLRLNGFDGLTLGLDWERIVLDAAQGHVDRDSVAAQLAAAMGCDVKVTAD